MGYTGFCLSPPASSLSVTFHGLPQTLLLSLDATSPSKQISTSETGLPRSGTTYRFPFQCWDAFPAVNKFGALREIAWSTNYSTMIVMEPRPTMSSKRDQIYLSDYQVPRGNEVFRREISLMVPRFAQLWRNTRIQLHSSSSGASNWGVWMLSASVGIIYSTKPKFVNFLTILAVGHTAAHRPPGIIVFGI